MDIDTDKSYDRLNDWQIYYMKNKILLIISFTFFCFYTPAAANIIKDSEIDETIDLIAKPLFKAARLNNTKVYIIKDDSLNAFTDGTDIYINSGMISQFNDIDVIRGVIAHETGHIVGKHMTRKDENIANYSKTSLSTMALGLAIAMSSGNADLLTPISLGGAHFAERSFLAYSRTFESSADQTALKLLEQNKYSSCGMIQFFDYMNRQHNNNLINPYDQTHPTSRERLAVLKNFYQHAKYSNAANSPQLKYRFARVQAKLLAFTVTDPNRLLKMIDPKLDAEINDYIKAICYFRIGDLDKSLHHINTLIKLLPRDPYYHELKGQILFEFGKEEALSSYITALNIRPNDMLIKFSKAIIGITIYINQPQKMDEYCKDLSLIIKDEPDNLTARYYLSIYYERSGKKAEGLLQSATIALKSSNIKRAKNMARAAIKDFAPDTPNWYKANDIILTEE